ncbi:MAG: PIN domain-containing protein [Solirubrobacterales bacterium]
MSGFLLDAGVWLAARDRDDRFHEDARALIGGGTPLTALDLTLYEVANVAAVRWRSAAKARRLVELVLAAAAPLVLADAELLAEASAAAAQHDITVYDAAYVAAAGRGGSTLVSTDVRDLVRPGLAISPAEATA